MLGRLWLQQLPPALGCVLLLILAGCCVLSLVVATRWPAISSALAPLLGYTSLHRLDVTVAGVNVTGGDLIAALHAGNPFVGLASVLRQQEAGAAFLSKPFETTALMDLVRSLAPTA